MPDTAAFQDHFDRVVYMQEEPFHSSSVFMQYFVMKAAREAGLVVLLDGQGADEVLLGYYNHLATYLHRLPVGQRLKAASEIVNNYDISVPLLFQLYFYYNNALLRRWRQLLKWKHLRSDIKNEFLDFEQVQRLAKLAKGPLFDYQEYEISTNNLPMLLRYEDKNSMAFSIESRLPFLDYRVVESVLNAPEHLRIQHGWSKYILRKAMEHQVPDEIVWRKRKFGFIPPNDVWLADDSYYEKLVKESKLLKQMFTTVKYPAHDRTTAWRLISVAAWERTFNVEI
jgi:asparagine synthase (glutamine-hydrolysing)